MYTTDAWSKHSSSSPIPIPPSSTHTTPSIPTRPRISPPRSPAADARARRRRAAILIHAAVVLYAEIPREPGWRARRALGAGHDDAPAAGGAALPAARHAVPLALVRARRAGRVPLLLLPGRDGGGGCLPVDGESNLGHEEHPHQAGQLKKPEHGFVLGAA
ncbi:hypothetical protein A9K55_005268 [Cordyceps militaris]|uniref:Uncharacterized protein n=1 Tax=Cordyceps militaris TaxID=73501 RepID=A0A2H4SP14_CORMI|nr:hypothetical protein A9K55_005268 [Cordyceps militaris]